MDISQMTDQELQATAWRALTTVESNQGLIRLIVDELARRESQGISITDAPKEVTPPGTTKGKDGASITITPKAAA